MANNCHFTYADFMTVEAAQELKEKLSTWQGERGDAFSTLYGLRVYISEPLGTRAEVARLIYNFQQGEDLDLNGYLHAEYYNYDIEEEDIDNGNWEEKDATLSDQMVFVLVEGWERSYYPEELWGFGISPISIWQIEGDDTIHFIPNDGYSGSTDFNTEDEEGYFEEVFESDGDRAYFQCIQAVLGELNPEIPTPYYQILSQDELTNGGQATHFFADNGESYPVINPDNMKLIRIIEIPE